MVTIWAGSSIKIQTLSATNAACKSNSNLTHLESCWLPGAVEAGDIASVFVKDLGLALPPTMCPEQSRAFKVNNIQAFTVGRKTKSHFFSGQAASTCSKECLYKVSRKHSENWLRRANIKPNLTPKIEYPLKPSYYDAKPWFCTLPHKSQNVHAVFER